jgi:hypothetical protein
MKFTGKFINEHGEEVDGSFDAASDGALIEHIRKIGWKIVNFKQVVSVPTLSEIPKFFFSVSIKRFVFLSIITMGFYELYWFYRNWEVIRDQENRKISPFWRTIFSVFFVYALFSSLLKFAESKDYKSNFSAGYLAAGWIIFVLLGRISDQLFGILSWILWCSSFFSFIFILPFLNVTKQLNLSNKVDSCVETVITPGQWTLIFLGLLMWILITLQLFYPVTTIKSYP